jgi:aminoglycoside phosphotransferase family enzyme/predicted kinase
MARMNGLPQSGVELDMGTQSRLVAALRQRLREAADGAPVELIETHISYVLIAGEDAWKIKKALNLGFADFSTLAQRRFYCNEELRLNRRTAAQLYLGVRPVTGTAEQPTLDGNGPVLDWVLHMRAFAQDGLWDRLAARGALGAAQIDALVEELCELHRGAAVAGEHSAHGRPEQVRAPMSDNLDVLDTLCRAGDEREWLQRLRQWEGQAFDTLRRVFAQRQAAGRVRECHGDLHLGNVTQIDGRAVLFDCLEFSAELRWTDVFSDVAFMAMDLRSQGLDALSHRFVNAYVERSGDAEGLRVLRYYGVHRALVRAKVAALRAAQLAVAAAPAERTAARQGLHHYLQVALRGSRHPTPALMLTHGFSGSGKTAATQGLLEACGAIRFRADVERKRLFGLQALQRCDAAQQALLYSSQASRATYARLLELATPALLGGFSVILDATFLAREARQQARALAERLGMRFAILDFEARPETLRERVRRRALRADDASDADLAVLEWQLSHAQPLQDDERESLVVFDAEAALDERAAASRWAPLLSGLGLQGP